MGVYRGDEDIFGRPAYLVTVLIYRTVVIIGVTAYGAIAVENAAVFIVYAAASLPPLTETENVTG